jgi:hypothetical protein
MRVRVMAARMRRATQPRRTADEQVTVCTLPARGVRVAGGVGPPP